MAKVHGYFARHMVPKPKHPKDSDWDYSLKKWDMIILSNKLLFLYYLSLKLSLCQI